jgi:hypothetical protein
MPSVAVSLARRNGARRAWFFSSGAGPRLRALGQHARRCRLDPSSVPRRRLAGQGQGQRQGLSAEEGHPSPQGDLLLRKPWTSRLSVSRVTSHPPNFLLLPNDALAVMHASEPPLRPLRTTRRRRPYALPAAHDRSPRRGPLPAPPVESLRGLGSAAGGGGGLGSVGAGRRAVRRRARAAGRGEVGKRVGVAFCDAGHLGARSEGRAGPQGDAILTGSTCTTIRAHRLKGPQREGWAAGRDGGAPSRQPFLCALLS